MHTAIKQEPSRFKDSSNTHMYVDHRRVRHVIITDGFHYSVHSYVYTVADGFGEPTQNIPNHLITCFTQAANVEVTRSSHFVIFDKNGEFIKIGEVKKMVLKKRTRNDWLLQRWPTDRTSDVSGQRSLDTHGGKDDKLLNCSEAGTWRL